ncbi:hypothetical protein MNBD_NITROSPINAE04-755, partial [hydrothermal vent metagenome]
RATYLVLLGLAGVGLMEKSGDKFRNTKLAESRLCKSSPDYSGHIFSLAARQMKNWMKIPEVLKTGEPIPKPAMDSFDAKEWHEKFICSMDALAKNNVDKLFEVLPLKDGMSVIDIGAGPATFIIEFAKRLPNLTATAFDRPASENVALNFAEKAGVADRISFAGGDFVKDSFEGKFDGALISNIIHMLSPAGTLDLMRRTTQALRPGGFLAINETVLGPDNDPGQAAIFAVQMMLGTKEGQVYTQQEICGWLEDVGLTIESVETISERSKVIVGRKGK